MRMSNVAIVDLPERESPIERFNTDTIKLEHLKDEDEKRKYKKSTVILWILATIFALSSIALTLSFWFEHKKNQVQKQKFVFQPPSYSFQPHFKRAAIVTNNGICSEIGRDIMISGGNAVDSTIAALLCLGVVNCHSNGIGGNFMMTIYNKTTGKCHSINGRSTAPASANETMFLNNPYESYKGYRSIALPTEIHGYWTAYKRFGSGKIPWAKLFEGSIKLCNEGFPVTQSLIEALKYYETELMKDPEFREIFVNPATNQFYGEGDVIRLLKLGATYKRLAEAEDPAELFYKGEMARTIAKEFADNGGDIKYEDLASYETAVNEAIVISDHLPGDLAMCGPPPPSSFIVTQSFITTFAELYKNKTADPQDARVYHDLIELSKFAYAQRAKLGDMKFVETAQTVVNKLLTKEYIHNITQLIKNTAQDLEYYSKDLKISKLDHGTSQVSTLDVDGNGVSVTSSVNDYFGSLKVSPTLGIFWNDNMDDFSTPGVSNFYGLPPSEANFIVPGKRPMSSMSPMVIFHKETGKVEMVIGSSGGSYIISGVSQTVIRNLFMNMTLKESIDAPRFHHQFLPHVTVIEPGTVPKNLQDILTNQYKQIFKQSDEFQSNVLGLRAMSDGRIYANADYRRKSNPYPSGF